MLYIGHKQNLNGLQKHFYQELLMGCLDRVYRYPMDYPVAKLRGQVVNRFAWRIGRQSGKTEALALGALYLGICKPIKYNKIYGVRRKSAMTPENPSGSVRVVEEYVRGAQIIMASADADKAKTVFDRVEKFIYECPEYAMALEKGVIEIKKHPFPSVVIHAEGWTRPAQIVFRGPGAGGQAARSKNV